MKPPSVPLSANADFNTVASPSSGHRNDYQSGHLHDHSHSSTDHAADQHIHSEASRKRIVNRLSRIEGHIRGVKTMVQDDRACPDVLVQIAAIRGGLDRVARIILDEHLSECITRAVDEGNIEAEIDALKAALDRFI